MNISTKKFRAGYLEQDERDMCENCGELRSTKKLPLWMEKDNQRGVIKYTVEEHGVEKKLRCAYHGFAVKKKSICDSWRPKDDN